MDKVLSDGIFAIKIATVNSHLETSNEENMKPIYRKLNEKLLKCVFYM